MQLQVGVKLIIESDGKILLLKRRGYDNLDSTWDIPGGRIDPSEPLLDALHREVREEIGTDFVNTPQLVEAQDIFPIGKNLHVVRLTYRLKEHIAIEQLSYEHSEAEYISVDDIDELTVDPLLRGVLVQLFPGVHDV